MGATSYASGRAWARLHGVTVRLHAGAGVLESLDRHLAAYLRLHAGDPHAPADWTVAAGSLGELRANPRPALAVEGPGEPPQRMRVLPASRRLEVYADPERWLVQATLRQLRHVLRLSLGSREMVFVHGALVRIRDRGVALVGEKRSGKTSTLLALLEVPGTAFVSNDDVSITFRRERPLGLGWPRSVRIRLDTLGVLELVGPGARGRPVRLRHPLNGGSPLPDPTRDPCAPGVLHAFPDELGRCLDRPVLTECAIDVVVFPSFAASLDAAPRIDRLDRSRALAALERHSAPRRPLPGSEHAVHLLRHFPPPSHAKIDPLLERLAASVPCFRLRQGFRTLRAGAAALCEALDVPCGPAGDPR